LRTVTIFYVFTGLEYLAGT